MRNGHMMLVVLAVVACGCASSKHKEPGDVVAAAPGARHDTARARQENAKAFELIQKGKYAEAEKAAKAAVDADVMFGPAHNNLGLVYYYQDELYPAAWAFQNAIKLM